MPDTSPNLPLRRRASFQLSTSGMMVALVSYPWIASQVKGWGYVPYRGMGIALTLGLGLAVLLVVVLVDYALAMTGLEKRTRSGMWVAAAWGPVISLGVWNAGGHPLWSQVAGIAGTLAGFGFGYFVSRLGPVL